MSKYTDAIRTLAKMKALDADSAEKLIEAHVKEQDGGAGSGNFGHAGRPGKKGGSAPGKGGTGAASTTAETSSGNIAPMGFKKGKTPPLVKKAESKKGLGFEDIVNGETIPIGRKESYNLISKPKQAKNPMKVPKNATMEERVRAARITNLGESSKKKAVSDADSGSRFVDKNGVPREGKMFPEGTVFNNPTKGKPTKNLPKGTGATKLDAADIAEGEHSVNKYIDDNGNLIPEREALHAQAVDNLFAGKKPVGPGEKKVAWLFGGGSAAGKGSLSDPRKCKYFGTPSKKDVATIDPDEFKEHIPEFRDMKGEKKIKEAAPFAHEESSSLGKRATQAAIDNGFNYTIDGTGDGSVGSVLKKIKQARDAGYEVNACYVTCPTEMALARAKKRAQEKGRDVPEKRLRKIHRDVSKILPQVMSEFDNVKLYDTSRGGDPVLVMECKRGQKETIHDQALWDAFVAKGNEIV